MADRLKEVVGTVFGLVFVLINVGTMPLRIAAPLRVLAVVACALVLAAVVIEARRPSSAVSEQPGGGAFTRGYWCIVAAEVVALVAGIAVVKIWLHLPQAVVAWIATIVGVHFFGLAVLWQQRFFHWLAIVLTGCGVAGLVMAVLGCAEAGIDLVSGVLPGVILLGFGLWAGASSFGPRRRDRPGLEAGH